MQRRQVSRKTGDEVTDVSMQDVTFSFGQGLKILNDFSFGAERGEFVYLFGENGSGKSTVLKILCGVMRARSGAVTILGKDPYCNPEILKRTGVVVDGMGFYGECSLRETRSVRRSLEKIMTCRRSTGQGCRYCASGGMAILFSARGASENA